MSDKKAADMTLPELLRTHMPCADGARMSFMSGDVIERAADEIERLTKERDELQDRVDDLIYEVRRMGQ